MKKILITGATGYLGRFFIERVRKSNELAVWLFVRNKDNLNESLIGGFNVVSKEELFSESPILQGFDAIVHLAFARTWDGKDLADSLTFTKQLALIALRNRCSFINVSSRSVYGNSSEDGQPWTEESIVKPDTTYAIAKFASEEVVSAIYSNCEGAKFTNVRLGSLAGFDFNQRIVSRFVDMVIKKTSIIVKSPNNMFSFLDVRDAAEGILSLLALSSENWKTVYNLGTEYPISLIELAKLVNDRASEYGLAPVKIVQEKELASNFDLMSSEKLRGDTGWTAAYNYISIIDSIYDFKLNQISSVS